jgi:protein SCO1/2
MIGTLRTVRWTACGLIVVAAFGMAILKFRPAGGLTAEEASVGTVSVPAGVAIGGPFHLTDDKGRNVTDADYRGRWMLVFVGYANCPDDCPPTLQTIAPLFITVDPARDTPARLSSPSYSPYQFAAIVFRYQN